jgi:predicted signal transduction protein with EAL and GGDEF domain
MRGTMCRCGVSIGIASDTDAVADPSAAGQCRHRALPGQGPGAEPVPVLQRFAAKRDRRTKRIADEILSGIDQNEFVAWFQPQVDAVTHEIVGVEALARWNHPTEGVLPPARS